MRSIQSYIINFLIRFNHLFNGKLKKEAFDDTTSIPDFRERCEKSAARYSKLPKGIRIAENNLDGMKMEYLIPEGAPGKCLVLYIHGGGYVSGSCKDHRGFVAKLAKQTGFTHLLFEYRLAPEHPYPAAIEDSIKVYRHLLDKGIAPENVLIAGESAGGGLTLALLLAIKNLELPYPTGAVAISPWTDLSCSGPSYISKNRVSPAPINSWTVFAKHYTGKDSNKNPLISPLFGELSGLPPIFIVSGTDDELYDDGEQFYLKAKQAGVNANFLSGKGMLHCYPLLAPLFPEATRAMEEIAEFVKKCLCQNP